MQGGNKTREEDCTKITPKGGKSKIQETSLAPLGHKYYTMRINKTWLLSSYARNLSYKRHKGTTNARDGKNAESRSTRE